MKSIYRWFHFTVMMGIIMFVGLMSSFHTTLFPLKGTQKSDLQTQRNTIFQSHGYENVQISRNIAVNNVADNNLEVIRSNSPQIVGNILQANGYNVQVPQNNKLQTPQSNELKNIARVQSITDGNALDGNAADGNAADGNAADGNAADGNAADGNAADGNAADGNAADGNAADGNAADGNAADGNAKDGNAKDGNAEDLESNHHQNHGQYSLKNAGESHRHKPRTKALQNNTNNPLTIRSHRLQDPIHSNSQNPSNASLQLSGRNSPSFTVNLAISKLNISLFNIRHINPEILDSIRMIHSPDPCGDDVYLVIIVHSAVENSLRRKLIRSTWAKPQATVKIIFILGTGNQNNMEFVAQEADEFTDLAQFGFLDSRRNLTWKHLMGLRWVKDFCIYAKYLLKIDDDVIVNTNIVLNTLQTLQRTEIDLNGIYCQLVRGSGPIRGKYKNRVSKEDYPGTKYPDFCKGFTYLVSTHWLPELYKATESERFLFLDDVYVTGILAEKASVPRNEMSKYMQYLKFMRLGTAKGHLGDLPGTSIVLLQNLRRIPHWWKIWCTVSNCDTSECHKYKEMELVDTE